MSSDAIELNTWRRRQVAWWIAISAAILAGVCIRVIIGMDRPGIWFDEFAWFTRFRRIRADELSSRAPAYLLLHKVLFQDVFSTFTEFRIRIASIVSGVLFLPLFALVVHRLFRSHWLTLIGALLASFNVVLASYTHEFKPYMLDLFLQTAWFYAAILVEDKRRAAIGGTCVLVVACLFSYSAVPLLGFQLVYLIYLRATGSIRGNSFFPSVLVVLLTIGASLLAYATEFQESHEPSYWGKKYGVFYGGPIDPVRFGHWLLEKISTYLTYPLNLFSELEPTEYGPGFPSGFGVIQNSGLGILFCGLALAYWLKHRWDDPRLIPLYVLGGYTLAGVFRIWPLGFFRTNLFLFLYAGLTVLGYMHSCTGWIRTSSAIVLLAPFAIFTLSNPIGEKINHLPTSQYLKVICDSDKREAIPIAADANAAGSARFYLTYDLDTKRDCGGRATIHRFKELRTLSRLVGHAPHESGTWVLVQSTSSRHHDTIRKWLDRRYVVRVVEASRRMYLLNVRRKPAREVGQVSHSSQRQAGESKAGAPVSRLESQLVVEIR